jgi:hypothetical protein
VPNVAKIEPKMANKQAFQKKKKHAKKVYVRLNRKKLAINLR